MPPGSQISRATAIAKGYGPKQCVECAEEVLTKLGPDNIQVVKIRTAPSTRNEMGVELPNGQTIQLADNGTHVILDVGGRAVDNVYAGLEPAQHMGKIKATSKVTVTVRPATDFFKDGKLDVTALRQWLMEQ